MSQSVGEKAGVKDENPTKMFTGGESGCRSICSSKR